MDADKSCTSCDHSERGGTGEVLCHRNPPQLVALMMQTLQGPQMVPAAAFPKVGALDWCGEWKAKAPKLAS